MVAPASSTRSALRVLHVTDSDLPGRRFNGYDLLSELPQRGITANQAVVKKLSSNPAVIALGAGRGDDVLQFWLREAERRLAINGLLVPWGRVLAELPAFRDADVVHYHLIHNQVVSLLDLPLLFAAKPSVWTFHDPWPLTGHCIHPLESQGWLTGCSPCPYLDREFPIALDRADRMWKVKQRVYGRLDVDIVVASRWMLDMVHRSPLGAAFERVHLIPFGIEPDHFLANDDRTECRLRLAIPKDDFVILLRANPWEAKGLRQAIAALAARRPSRSTTVLALDGQGLLNDLRGRYRVVELGWVDDPRRYAEALCASDVFALSSLAESFGLMAVEAMAAGRPVVCFEGTAVPAITHAPEVGIAVPWGDTEAFRSALDDLSANPAEAERRGGLGRDLVREEYRHATYVDALVALYQAVLARRLPD